MYYETNSWRPVSLKKKKINFYLRLLSIAFLSLVLFQEEGRAQRNIILYSLQNVPQTSNSNPAIIPDIQGYFGLPLLSNVNAGLSNTSFTFKEFGIPSFSNIDEDNFDFQNVLTKVNARNRLIAEADLELINFGFHLGKGFITFSLTEHTENILRYPPDLIQLGADVDEDINVQGNLYDLSQLDFNLVHYRTIALGYAKALNARINVGIKAKLLMGLENLWSENTGLQLVTLDNSDTYGVANRLEILSAGLGRFSDDNDFSISKYFTNPGNYGLAFDIGGTFKINNKFRVEASLINLGFIRWSSGVNYYVISDIINDLDNLADDIEEDLIDGKPRSPITYQTPLAPEIIVGGRYQLNSSQIISLLINSKFYRGYTDVAAAVMYNFQINKWFGFSLNYAAYHQSYVNLGTGVSFALGPVQIYAATDNILGAISPTSVNNAHLNFGINFLIGKNKKEIPPGSIASNAVGTVMAADSLVNQNGVVNNQGISPENPSLETPSSNTPEGAIPDRPKFRVNGHAFDKITGKTVGPIYIDIFRLSANFQRDFIRSTAFPEGRFTLALQRSENLHELEISTFGYQLGKFTIDPTVPQKTYEFGLSPDETEAKSIPEALKIEAPVVQAEEEFKEEMFEVETKATEEKVSEDINQPPNQFSVTLVTSLRREATSRSKVLRRLNEGAIVKLLEKTNQYWWKVDLNGEIGYVKAALLAEYLK